MSTNFTRIIPQHPGYYYRYFSDSNCVLEWTPVASYYSPPLLHPNVTVKQVQVDAPLEKGLIIGKQGKHFKRITEATGCLYIFLKQDTIEIWGTEQAVQQATTEIQAHLATLHKQSIFCPHETNDLCATCKDCSTCRMVAHCYGCHRCATCNPQSQGYCKGCGGCQSCAPIFTQGYCEDCYEHEDWNQYFKEEEQRAFDYTEHFRANYAPALTYAEADFLLQRGPPSDYICCQAHCDESEACMCCSGVCSH